MRCILGQWAISSSQITPNEDPSKWDAGESLIVSEAMIPETLLSDGDWPAESFYVRVVYEPAEKVIYQDTVSVESSTPAELVEYLDAAQEDHGDDNWGEIYSAGGGFQQYAQTFKVEQSGELYKVSLYLRNSSSGPNEPLTVELQTNETDGGPPTGEINASATVDAATINTDIGRWVNITFDTSVTVVAGQYYAIVASLADTSTSSYYWAKNSTIDSPEDTYSSGEAWNKTSDTWDSFDSSNRVAVQPSPT